MEEIIDKINSMNFVIIKQEFFPFLKDEKYYLDSKLGGLVLSDRKGNRQLVGYLYFWNFFYPVICYSERELKLKKILK